MNLVVSRRKFLLGLCGLGAVGLTGSAYSIGVEPRWLEVNERTVTTAGAPPGPPVRLLHLSDLHASPVVSLNFLRTAIERGLSLRPDLICVTGDFITRAMPTPNRYAEVLKVLSAAAPTFATLGNHDGGAWTAQHGGNATTAEVRSLLQAAKIPCIHNSVTSLEVRGRRIELVGTGDLWSGECRPDLAFASLARSTRPFRVVMSHNPDSKDLFEHYDWDLLLCGHTHGGQIRLPLLGTPFAPVVDLRYVEGLHSWQGRQLHVSKGVGNLLGVRFNCRPEVTLLNLI